MWIKTKDKLPELSKYDGVWCYAQSEDLLLLEHNKFLHIGFLVKDDDGDTYWVVGRDGDAYNIETITHWQYVEMPKD